MSNNPVSLSPTNIEVFSLLIPSLGIAQCDLKITDPPAVCEPEKIDLTDPAVTEGSSSGMSLTYWVDSAATVALSNPNSVAESGTYYIKAESGEDCSVVMQVIVRINPEIVPAFDPIGPLDQNEAAPPLETTSLNGVTGSWDPPSINTAIAGTFTFTFTPDTDQCAIPLTMDITIIAATGIEQELYKTVFEVYPNPNRGTFNLVYQSSDQGPVEMAILDITGRVCYSRFYTNTGKPLSEIIQLNNSLIGVYLVRLISDTEVLYKKILIH